MERNPHPFGIKVFVHIPVEARKPGTKLLHRAEEGLFVGYGCSTKTACVYVPSRDVVFETRDLKFQSFAKHQAADSVFQLYVLDANDSQPPQSRSSSVPSYSKPT
jgi:hypothetical protein